MAVSELLSVAAVVVATILALGGVVAMLWAVGKVRGVEASIGILNDANTGLRQAYTDVETKASRDREHFQLQLHQQEKECLAKISKLEGQLDTLTGGLAERIVSAVTSAIEREHMKET